MPSIARSNQWFIRITAPWEHIRSKLETIQGWIDFSGMMVGLHHGDKQGAPHGHIAIRLKSELQKQSIDSRCKKLFDVERQQYSSKLWDGNIKALSYLYHDPKGEVINHMNLSDEEIKVIKTLNEDIQKVVQANKGRASHKVVDYVLEKAKSSDMVMTRWEIGECILKAVAEGQFYDPGDFVLERYINEIELKLNKDDKHNLQEVIASRLNRLSSFRR